MDEIQRDTMFSGLTDREIAEAMAREMHRRGVFGILFMFPEAGGPSVCSSSVPAGSMQGWCVAEQLAFFAQVATLAISEREVRLDSELKDPKWLN
jgi:hypothetical protein